VALFLLMSLCLSLPALGEQAGISFDTVPGVLRPGKLYDIVVNTPGGGMLAMDLLDADGNTVYGVYEEYPAVAGLNRLHWDGLRMDYSVIPQGEYLLRVSVEGETTQTPLRIGAPYPLLSHVRQSDALLGEGGIGVTFDASVEGAVEVQLRSYADNSVRPLETVEVTAGDNTFHWDGQRDGARVPDGEYGFILCLKATNNTESMQHFVPFTVGTGAPVAEADGEAYATIQDVGIVQAARAEEAPTSAAGGGAGGFISAGGDEEEAAQAEPTASGEPDEDVAADVTPEASPDGEEAEAEATDAVAEETAGAAASGQPSPPYSDLADGTFWSMTPGETDDAVTWDVLTQPITVYDGGLDQRDHVYLMENPDGTGKQLAQIHAQSQGLHVLSERNEHGYVLVEAFSSYDDKYYPDTAEEKAHAFDVKQGYVRASGLKEVKVQQDMALVIDKLSQRMYLYKNGEPVTEYLICTGLIVDDKYWYETTPGEFITVSHSGGFFSGKYMYCDMAIRINGGILLHEVPHEPLGDGTKRYAAYEAVLGTKASHGCVRIQRTETPEGYNHAWLWNNLKHGAPYKVIIWDDLNRTDTPTTWQPNP
ncbi:L,D-transpeptidase family protein, partial [Eubacteriales bacterium OttesenSCG-928-A19]|nr:L,D-transpeptidase family protein [Eubacteriales bacterium OttesenSCG-928-A19]